MAISLDEKRWSKKQENPLRGKERNSLGQYNSVYPQKIMNKKYAKFLHIQFLAAVAEFISLQSLLTSGCEVYTAMDIA